jgi:hypothetical protein
MTRNELHKYLLEHHPESKLRLMSGDSAAALVAKYPMLPSDYVAFLCEVGSGTVGDSRYSVYGGPMDPSEVFDRETADGLSDVVLIGDDFAGGHEAYRFEASAAVFGNVDSASGHFEPHAKDSTFSGFIESWFVE